MNRDKQQEIVRFAPSPTGDLHIGSVRTAYFNWLYAKVNQGIFKLRIEDTDKFRSKIELTNSIIKQLDYLGLKPDGEIVQQSKSIKRHIEVANQLLNQNQAYKCFATQEELQKMKEENLRNKSKLPFYNRKWRDVDSSRHPKNQSFVIRLKVDLEGKTEINDLIQGKVSVDNKTLDDFVILRSDQTPTYNFSVVVDDHDMSITTVLRGDDHLTNSFRQYQVYKALDWLVPKFGHFPLIHNQQGSKMSKRNDNISLDYYLTKKGYLPQAILNYCLRLGFGYQDLEIIDTNKAIEIFDLKGIGKSPSKFDLKKLNFLSLFYMKKMYDDDIDQLIKRAIVFLPKKLKEADDFKQGAQRFKKGLKDLVARSNNLSEVTDLGQFYFEAPNHDKKTDDIISKIGFSKEEIKFTIVKLTDICCEIKENFSGQLCFDTIKDIADKEMIKLHLYLKTLRLALTGSFVSPSIKEIIDILGYEEVLSRLDAFSKFLSSKRS